jgi:hypothetical protein
LATAITQPRPGQETLECDLKISRFFVFLGLAKELGDLELIVLF